MYQCVIIFKKITKIMHLAMYSIIIITGVIVCTLFVGQTFVSYAQEQTNSNIITERVAESAIKWIDGDIADDEFWNALVIMLSELEHKASNSSKNKTGTVLPPPTQSSAQKTLITESVRMWIEDRTTWWLEGKITDMQFLNAVQHLNKAGYLKNIHISQNTSYNTNDISLENIILTEQEIDKITKASVWRFVKTEHDFDETNGVKDSIRILMRDIKRVYEPIFNKYKIPTMSMQITQLSNNTSIDDYWLNYTNQTSQEIIKTAHKTSNISDDSICIFKYSDTGAITICMLDKIIIQVVIFDMYNEHYQYKMPDIKIDKTEPTVYIMDKIIKKINIATGNDVDLTYRLHNILQNSKQYDMQNYTNTLTINSTLNTSVENKSNQIINDYITNIEQKNNISNVQQQQTTDLEKSLVYGVTSLHCIKDDFGVVTITGQYVNDNIPKKQINVNISFVDWSGNLIGKTSISFIEIVEYETKRFFGHIKWDENFALCQINH